MKAVVVSEPGGPEVLTIVERPVPALGADDVLVRVHATSINRADVNQRTGLTTRPADDDGVLGLEVAGVIEQVGANVDPGRRGERVFGLTAGGGYAQFAVLPAAHALRVPESMTFVQAATVAEVFVTAMDNLVNRGRLTAGESVLVHGGSGGVGSAAIQIAVERGATVLTTVGSDEKVPFCRELGAAHVINYRTERFEDRVHELTEGRGVDLILDVMGGDHLNRNLGSLALDGRLVIVGLLGGRDGTIGLGSLLLPRRLTVTGSTLRPRTVAAKAQLLEQLRQELLPGFTHGTFRTTINAVFPLSEVIAAHTYFDRGEHVGKVVLEVVD